MKYCLPTFLLALLLALSGLVCGQESSVLSLKAHIPLPNVNGRIDHLSVDVKGQRLFVAAVDNHTLEVIDLKSGQHVHTITDLAEPQGVFYVSLLPALLTALQKSLTGRPFKFSRPQSSLTIPTIFAMTPARSG